MSEASEILSPEVLQIQLISVYKSLPERAVAGARMNQALEGRDLSALPQELAEHYAEKAATAGIDYSNRAEVPAMKKQLLEKLLSAADLTQASKTYIAESFGANFAFGSDDTMQIYQIIGVTDNSRKEAGIFSKDPETRKQIERGIANEMDLDIKSLKVDYPEGEEDEEINSRLALFAEFKEQYFALYNEMLTL